MNPKDKKRRDFRKPGRRFVPIGRAQKAERVENNRRFRRVDRENLRRYGDLRLRPRDYRTYGW